MVADAAFFDDFPPETLPKKNCKLLIGGRYGLSIAFGD
jgi:hypothetical protein